MSSVLASPERTVEPQTQQQGAKAFVLAEEIERPSADEMLAGVRRISAGPLAAMAEDIDRGTYPEDILHQLGSAGAYMAHLNAFPGGHDYPAAIEALAEVSRVCGSTGFLVWCQLACALYLERSTNPALQGDVLLGLVTGEILGGTGLSNAMKSITGIEKNQLRARSEGDGYVIDGMLPWVSNLGGDHQFCAVALLEDESGGGSAEGIPREVMFTASCADAGVSLRPCPAFSGMEGTATYSMMFAGHRVPARNIVAAPARPFIASVRAAFVLLQCGMGWGVTQGAIDSMREVGTQLAHVNEFLDDQPDALQSELDVLKKRINELAATPYDSRNAFFAEVLKVRAAVAELALRSAQAALLHQGARGYLMSSTVQRRVRESHFVAIVTPAIKHIRKEISRLASLPA